MHGYFSMAMTRALAALLLAGCSTEVTGAGGAADGGGGTTAGATVAAVSSTHGSGGAGGEVALPTPEQCEAFTDEASCIAGGCSLFERLRELRVDEQGTCRYGAEFRLCIGWEHVGVAVGGAAVTGWYRIKDGSRQDIEGNAVYQGGLPGWNGCDTDEPSDGACACAGRVEE